jgi:hypothetical protein
MNLKQITLKQEIMSARILYLEQAAKETIEPWGSIF